MIQLHTARVSKNRSAPSGLGGNRGERGDPARTVAHQQIGIAGADPNLFFQPRMPSSRRATASRNTPLVRELVVRAGASPNQIGTVGGEPFAFSTRTLPSKTRESPRSAPEQEAVARMLSTAKVFVSVPPVFSSGSAPPHMKKCREWRHRLQRRQHSPLARPQDAVDAILGEGAPANARRVVVMPSETSWQHFLVVSSLSVGTASRA